MSINSNYISRIVRIGNLSLGGSEPIRIQSMTNTSSMDVEASVKQISELYNSGCELVRLTVRNLQEADSLGLIRAKLYESGIDVPLAADIHFNPKVAEKAAAIVQKVRINPGNYLDHQYFLSKETNRNQTAVSSDMIKEGVARLVEICRENNTVIRVGVNHGSLSERIMQKYGNTAEGMIASAMEFLQICKELDFHELVVSMKSSHVPTMVKATLGVVEAMKAHGMDYPIHLGVTEAGEGQDGRIRSAAGIGPLLAMGIGDTIRVSLTEDPIAEIPVAKKLVSFYEGLRREGKCQIPLADMTKYDYRETESTGILGGQNPVAVLGSEGSCDDPERPPDLCRISETMLLSPDGTEYPLVSFSSPVALQKYLSAPVKNTQDKTLVFKGDKNNLADMHAMFSLLSEYQCKIPVVVGMDYKDGEDENILLRTAADLSSLILCFCGNGYEVNMKLSEGSKSLPEIVFGILQATGRRITGTEYISCPTCGRTSFDIQATLKDIKEKTKHLKDIKIAVMGCIVNGPGEMAEADYGYVGAGRGKVTLYHKGKAVKKNIPEGEAVKELLQLIGEG